MIAIQSICGYIPFASESNLSKKAKFGVDDDFIINKIGVLKVARKDRAEETSDMCIKAFESLTHKTSVPVDRIDCIIVCTQNPDGRGLPHTSAIVHGKLGASDHCAAFDISLGCSGYVYGLSIILSFMEINNLATGLLFTADPYSKIINDDDKNTALLFGDAATVTLLRVVDEQSGVRWRPTRFAFGTRGREANALQNRDGLLEMNGRSIFNFSATTVPLQVQNLLDKEGLKKDDIDLYIFHQGSKYILDTIQKRMALPSAKIPIGFQEYGNTVSSSIPLLLKDVIDQDGVSRILLCGFGVGLSWATCILERLQ